MKNAVVISSFVPNDNASPAVVNSKMMYLCSNSFEKVRFITSNFPEEAVTSFNNIELINIRTIFEFSTATKKLCNYILMQLKVLKNLNKCEKSRTVFIFWLSGPMLIPFLYCILKHYKTVTFLYGNSKYKSEKVSLFNRIKSQLMKFMAVKADYLCVEALSVAEPWGINLSKHKLYKVHLYIDTQIFKPIKPYKSRENIIGMCCRLVSSKRVLEAIKAFSIFRRKFNNYKLQIAGSGYLFDKCQKLIQELGESENITLLGWVDNSKMPEIYNNWKLLLNPTNYEGLPNSLLESMACGTPSLSSGVGGIPDVIKENETGWILEKCIPGIIADRLTDIFNNQDLCQISNKAGVLIFNRYSKSIALENFQAFVSNIF